MFRPFMRRLGLLVCPGFALSLVAQQASPPPVGGVKQDSMLDLLNTPVESASKRRQKSIESPQAIEVLTAEQIRASGVFRLIDALKLMTSLQVFEFGKDVARLTIRGTVANASMNNVQVLVDGVPLFNTETYYSIPFNLIPIPIEAIERVEVVRGPSSSLYGANAQVGVIAITTKTKEGNSLGLRGGAAENGTYNSQGFFSYGTSQFTLAAAFGGSSQRDSGISERVLGGARRVDPQDQNHTSQVFLRPEVVLGEGRIWAMYAKAATRVGPQVQEAPTGEKLYQWTFLQSSTEVAQVGWSQNWSPVFRTQLKLNRSHLTPLSVSAMAVVPGSPISAGTVPYLQSLDPGLNSDYDMLDTTIDQAVLQGNWDPSESLHFVFGLDSARMKAQEAPIVGAPADSQDSATGGFASMDWIQGPATISLGARVENETLGGSRVSPRAALVYVLPEGSVLRAGYFTSTRSPSVFEVKQALPPIPGRPAPIGNPDAQPERVENFEIGFRKNFARWSLDFTAYQMNLKKVIGPEPTGVVVGGFPQTQFRNSATSLVNKGLELSAKGELALGWLLGFNAAAVDFQDDSGVQQSYSSKFKANLWTRYQYGDLQAYVALQHTGAYTITNAEDFAGPREDAPARLQVHFNLSYSWDPSFMVSIYGINAARASEESTAGSTNNNYLIRFARREMGLQASYRF